MSLDGLASMLEDLNVDIKLGDTHISATDAAAGLSPDGASVTMAQTAAPAQDALRQYYAGKQFEYGFSSICKMVLPVAQLKGKKVLDICCRRGRGVYKISSMVGNEGQVWGIDWSQAYIEEAQDGADRAWHKSGLSHNNMEFRIAYPEDLSAAGIGSATMDAVYVNNVMTLFYDQAHALREFGRVLKSGGLLIMETVYADRPRSEGVVQQAREMGNSIQAAHTQQENEAWLAAAGFDAPEVQEEYEVEASRGYQADRLVEIAEGDEDVRYRAVALFVWKK